MIVGLILLGACSRHGRIIPQDTLSSIYADIFVADQWLRDHGSARVKADTTLFYDPIFEKYGYDREDFLASVNHYVSNPEKFEKILASCAEMIKAEQRKYEKYAEIEEKARKANEIFRHYRRQDFSSDSLNWARCKDAVWLPWRDTLVRDTVFVQAVDSTAFEPLSELVDKVEIENVTRKDSLRTHTKPPFGKLSGHKSLAGERKDMQL